MTSVFHASTLPGVAGIAAALDAGLFGEHDRRRLLIVSNTAPIPELAAGFATSPAFADLRSRFDEVVDWNDLIAPLHPSHWLPPEPELPMLSRLITERLGLTGGVTELVVDSVTAAPGAAIATLLRDCPVTVHCDDLSSYGPTRRSPHPAIGRRVRRLLHRDLVADLAPLLLREYDVQPAPLPEVPLHVPESDDSAGCPVIVAPDLARRGILTGAEETDLLLRMLRAVAARGERRVVLRPAPQQGRPRPDVVAEADRLGIELVTANGLPTETLIAAVRPSLVVSCVSPALFTARRTGIEVASVGTEIVLERLAPYEHEFRVPATIVDAALPRLQADGTVDEPPTVDVRRLVEAVAYCMQADRLPDLRDAAVAHLAEHGPQQYFKKRRLETLGLRPPPPPAAPAPTPAAPPVPVTARRAARRLLTEARTAVERRRQP